MKRKKKCDCSWTALTGKNWKFQSPNAGRNRIAKMEREFLFQPVGTEKGEFFRRSSAYSGKFPIELRVPFAFKPVEPEILPKWKAPQVSVLERCTIWESCLYCKLENALNKGLKSNFTAMTNKQQCQTRNEQRNREEQLPERRRQFSSPP